MTFVATSRIRNQGPHPPKGASLGLRVAFGDLSGGGKNPYNTPISIVVAVTNNNQTVMAANTLTWFGDARLPDLLRIGSERWPTRRVQQTKQCP